MRRQTIIDVVPRVIDGRVVYVETDLRGLGVTAATPAPALTTVQNVTGLVNAANAAIPPGKVTVQSDFSKTANVVATGASVVAAATVWFPPAAIIAGIVAAAAALLGKIFANSKAKAYAAERGEYEKVNAQTKYEINELDKQFDVTYPAVQQIKGAISSLSGFDTLGALGICWGNCKEEKARLASAKAEYEVLQRELNNKTQLMASLLDEYNKLMKELINIKSSKSTKDWLAVILVGSAVLGLGYYFIKSKSK